METIVTSAKRHWSKNRTQVIRRLLEIGINPVMVLVVLRDLGKRVDLLPSQVFQSRKLELWILEIDCSSDNTKFVLLKVQRLSVEVELLEICGGATDNFNGSRGIDIANKVEDLAVPLRGADQIACLDNHVGCAVVIASRGNPEVVRLIAVCRMLATGTDA